MTTSKGTLRSTWQSTLMVMLVTLLVMMPSLSYAAWTPMGDAICQASYWVMGNVGRGLAILAIMIIGIGAMLGKVSWGMAMVVGSGIAIIFGATTLATYLMIRVVVVNPVDCWWE
jgi:type IV secretory pathway VirB2 component (pilin)